eukprot:767040-Hanusia_phi.AAC.1
MACQRQVQCPSLSDSRSRAEPGVARGGRAPIRDPSRHSDCPARQAPARPGPGRQPEHSRGSPRHRAHERCLSDRDILHTLNSGRRCITQCLALSRGMAAPSAEPGPRPIVTITHPYNLTQQVSSRYASQPHDPPKAFLSFFLGPRLAGHWQGESQ